MVLDAWLPVGFELPGGDLVGSPRFGDQGWQIVETKGGGRALLAGEDLIERWIGEALVDPGAFRPFQFGRRRISSLSSAPSRTLSPVKEATGPNSRSEALAFAQALRATRDLDPDSPLQDALYVETISRLLPTYSISSEVSDDVVLGFWLTGGARVSARSFRRVHQMLTWMEPSHLRDVIEAAGFEVGEVLPSEPRSSSHGAVDADSTEQGEARSAAPSSFKLPGRPDLESFINEHIVDIILKREHYRSFGIQFPSATVLHGPPGTGKTFAVERLVEFLGWPSFEIDASSVASPYIHETSRKVSEVFDRAMDSAPSVVVIDEMEAFLADRGSAGSQQHRVEEVAEFLRRIPEAAEHDVLVIAMTNRIDIVDPAVLRRGRFDHVVEVGFASESEIRSLLAHRLDDIPVDEDVDSDAIAAELAGRPLSDVAFVVREAARLAARDGKDRLDQESLIAAMRDIPDRSGAEEERRVGFV